MTLKVLTVPLAAAVGGALVVAGLWAWQGAPDMALDWGAGRPEVATWAIRSAAVAVIAAAQVVLLALVAGRIFQRRGTFDTVLTFTAVAVVALASVSAVACGLAGR